MKTKTDNSTPKKFSFHSHPMKLSVKFLAVLVSISFCLQASAATITVMNTSDSGAGSLREALANANDGDAIDATGVTGTITLTSGELLVNKSVTITGPGAANLAVDGNAASRVFLVNNAVTATISGLTITNGRAPDVFPYGGGTFNDFFTTFTLSNCIVSGNSALFGGGIYSAHATLLTVSNCTVSANSSYLGGGIVNDGYVYSGTLIVSNSTISGNSAIYGGGATYGGGIWNYGAGSASATTTISNSTISGNSATYGGGIWNTHDGIDGSSTLTVVSTILKAGASGENILNNEFGTLTSLGYNLSSDAAGGDGTTGPGGYLNATGDMRNTDPLLGPLQNNGGPTFTHKLLNGSPAIDAGRNFSTSTTDQRGPGFVRTFDNPSIANASGGDGTDIGAYEVQLQYAVQIQQPINADGTSVFNVRRGVVPVKFTLTLGGVPTCDLPPATIALTRTAGGAIGAIDESIYVMAADSGSNFRIDSCQYIYNLSASALGVGTYRVDININGQTVGSGFFGLK